MWQDPLIPLRFPKLIRPPRRPLRAGADGRRRLCQMARRARLRARPGAGLRGQALADLRRVSAAAEARQLLARPGAGEAAGGRRQRQALSATSDGAAAPVTTGCGPVIRVVAEMAKHDPRHALLRAAASRLASRRLHAQPILCRPGTTPRQEGHRRVRRARDDAGLARLRARPPNASPPSTTTARSGPSSRCISSSSSRSTASRRWRRSIRNGSDRSRSPRC